MERIAKNILAFRIQQLCSRLSSLKYADDYQKVADYRPLYRGIKQHFTIRELVDEAAVLQANLNIANDVDKEPADTRTEAAHRGKCVSCGHEGWLNKAEQCCVCVISSTPLKTEAESTTPKSRGGLNSEHEPRPSNTTKLSP